MLNSQYVQNEKRKHFFLLPNALFDIELHIYALAIYAYLMRIEDRRTYQCVASYSNIARYLSTAPNTVAKYVRTLEERGLIRTERTEFVTKDGRKRNGCLRYHILPFRQALDRHRERQLAELEFATARQNAKAKAEKLGIQFIPTSD